MEWTPFAGLTALDENDSITIDGGSFLIKNPRITDELLQVGAVTHRHDAHPALPSPVTAVTGSALASGGQIDAGLTYALSYTVIDSYGGETMPAPALVLTTGGTIDAPTIAPSGAVDTAAGIMPSGSYYYALTYTDGAGGETTLGPVSLIYIDPGFASAEVQFTGLTSEFATTGAQAWRLWRSYEGADWHLVTQGSTDTFTDAGFDPPDNPALPPEANSTLGQGSITVTLPNLGDDPALAGGTAINLYMAPDAGFVSPSLYARLPLSAAGTTIIITSDAMQVGSPPHVSTCKPGARQIDPDTDLLDWHWKRPVATADDLPMTGNGDGDARITRDTEMIWIWDDPNQIWNQWNPGGGVLAASQQSGDYQLVLSDSGTVVEFMAATAVTLTIPAHVVAALPVGAVIEVFQYGAGQVTVAAGSGVTLRSDSNRVKTAAQYATISLRQRDLDEWVISGDTA